MRQTDVRKLYESFAEKYDRKVFEERDYIAFEIVPQWIIDILGKNGKILDLGCGTGLSSLKFFEKGYKVTGVDLTPEMLKIASRLPYEKLVCQSVEDPLLFEKGTFQGVVLLGVMEFIKFPHLLFDRVFSLLEVGGVFGLTIPKKLNAESEKKLDIFSHRRDEIEAMAQKSKFEIIKEEEFQGFVSEGIIVEYYGCLLKKN